MKTSKSICWITWEDHRRSKELAKSLGADYIFIKSNEKFILRHIIKSILTIKVLINNRKSIVVVQNPSRILACLAAILKVILKYPLIVDRHTNFRLGKKPSLNPAIWFVIICSEISIRLADLTIVTNDYLKELVERKGGRGFVLYDKIPDLKASSETKDLNQNIKKNDAIILFVCTYAADEPYRNVFKAAELLPEGFKINITGNYSKVGISPGDTPSNVELLGFVSEKDYIDHLNNSDVVLVLTSAEWCLVCGGYEAMSVGKPLITSNTTALNEFYDGSAIVTEHDPMSLAAAITNAVSNKSELSKKITVLKEEKQKQWEESWANLHEVISDLST